MLVHLLERRKNNRFLRRKRSRTQQHTDAPGNDPICVGKPVVSILFLLGSLRWETGSFHPFSARISFSLAPVARQQLGCVELWLPPWLHRHRRGAPAAPWCCRVALLMVTHNAVGLVRSVHACCYCLTMLLLEYAIPGAVRSSVIRSSFQPTERSGSNPNQREATGSWPIQP